jgi:hypothetical protein
MRATLVAIVALVAIACGHARNAVGNASTPPADEPLGARLVRVVGAGRSVAIVGGSMGLRAISSDGERQQVLVAGAVEWSLMDQRANVVWFGTHGGKEIDAIDLEARAEDPPHVEVIVTGLPDPHNMQMVGPIVYGLLYPDPHPDPSGPPHGAMGPDFSTGGAWNMTRTKLTLDVGPTPSLYGSTGYVSNDEWVDAVKKAAIPGRAFVASLPARPSHAPPEPKRPERTRVDSVDPKNCEDPEQCGEAEPIAGTKYLRVMTANFAGDVRHITYKLYDGETKQFVAGEWSEWLDEAIVAPDHTAFVVGGHVVSFARGIVAATPKHDGAIGGGWIGGGDAY